MNSPASPPDWSETYRQHRPQYVSFSDKIKGLLQELLARESIDIAQIEARAKDVDSFTAKLARPGKYADPLNDMTDLAGVRVVCYYLSDVARIGAVIRDVFNVVPEHSVSQEMRNDPDRFGYASDHYVVRCSSMRTSMPEWSSYANLQAEIQVRTVLQHAWAAIDHKLAYKRASEVPDALIRQLSRVSALLEIGDEQFEAARAASERLDASNVTRARRGDFNLPIDVSSVHAYIANSAIAARLTSIASGVGFTIAAADTTDSVGSLVRASHIAGFDEMSDLDAFLTDAEQWARTALDVLWKGRPLDAKWHMPIAFVLASLIWIGGAIDFDTVPEMANVDPFFVALLKTARQAIE